MQLIVLAGVQGAGKSTFCQQRFWQTHIRLTLDMLKTRNREDILLHACLAAQQRVVVDNTLPTADQRARYAQLARAAGFSSSVYFFDVPIADALKRNAQRPPELQIPEIGVRGTFAKLQRPTAAEGFDEIFIVRVIDNQFQVEALQ
jgi:predicted kinase